MVKDVWHWSILVDECDPNWSHQWQHHDGAYRPGIVADKYMKMQDEMAADRAHYNVMELLTFELEIGIKPPTVWWWMLPTVAQKVVPGCPYEPDPGEVWRVTNSVNTKVPLRLVSGDVPFFLVWATGSKLSTAGIERLEMGWSLDTALNEARRLIAERATRHGEPISPGDVYTIGLISAQARIAFNGVPTALRVQRQYQRSRLKSALKRESTVS